jgi:hemolysin activation/secretion protein
MQVSGAQAAEPQAAPEAAEATAASQLGNLYIAEYRVRGNHILKPIDIEKAVYPYMGPGTLGERHRAGRQGLEKAYRDLGYQTVYVEVPQQTGARESFISTSSRHPWGVCA